MKQEDFERLKAVCEKEGFWVDDNHSLGLFHIMVKDIWDGVDFALNPKGFVRKIEKIEHGLIYFIGDFWYHKNVCKPSTESAYIEQLKKEAHKRFGEIKDGDRFEIEGSIELTVDYGGMGFRYYKDQDLLCNRGYHLYKKGKWATRVKERVKVEFDQKCWATISEGKQEIELTFLISKPVPCIEAMKTFLASQLEKYLNGEIE